MEKLKISLSEGEIIDRYTILDIKNNEIEDSIKKKNIKKELICYSCFDSIRNQYILYYKLLYFVNKKIWNLQNNIKHLNDLNKEYAELSYNIFEYNHKRFRLKNIINILAESEFKEQKNYKINEAFLNIEEENENNFILIIYLILNYDVINIYLVTTLSSKYILRIKSLFPSINYVYDKCERQTLIDKQDEFNTLKLYCESQLEKMLNPLFYRTEGKLGDFILQLSVINENYLKTGRKGILYIYNNEYKFTFPLENTYKDTYDLLIQQNYIQGYKIWNSEYFDINLSSWYKNNLLYTTSWYHIFNNEYDVNWGKNKWINTRIDPIYADKIVITFHTKDTTVDMMNHLSNYDKNNILLVGYSDNDLQNFKSKYGFDLEFKKCNTIEDMAIIINSCKFYIGTLSSPLTLAQATHKKTLALLDSSCDSNHNILNDILPDYMVVR